MMAEQDPAAMPYHSGGGFVSPILRRPETQDFNHQEYGMCNLRACIASLIPIHSSQQLVIVEVPWNCLSWLQRELSWCLAWLRRRRMHMRWAKHETF